MRQYYMIQNTVILLNVRVPARLRGMCWLNLCWVYTVCLFLLRLALLVREQSSDLCPVQTAGFPSADRFPHFKSRHLWRQHLNIWLLQRDSRDIQHLTGWWVFDHLDLDVPGKSQTRMLIVITQNWKEWGGIAAPNSHNNLQQISVCGPFWKKRIVGSFNDLSSPRNAGSK